MNQHVVVAIDAPFGAPSALQVLFGGIRKSCVDSLFPELVSTATSPQYRRTETDMQDQLGFDSKTVLQLSGVYRAFISKFSQVIQSDSWAIFPVKGDLDSAEKTCIECYPRATAKALGLPDEGYKSSRDMGEDRADGIRSARKTIIDGLKLIVAIEQDIEAYLLDNDDAIDAVLSAITALEWWRNRNDTSFSRFRALTGGTMDQSRNEGWIIYPTPAHTTFKPTGPTMSVSENS